MILDSEEFYTNNTKVMDDVTQFLNLPHFDFASSPLLNQSWGGGISNLYDKPHDYIPLNNITRDALKQFFEPYNQRLYKIISHDFGW